MCNVWKRVGHCYSKHCPNRHSLLHLCPCTKNNEPCKRIKCRYVHDDKAKDLAPESTKKIDEIKVKGKKKGELVGGVSFFYTF